MAKEIKVDTKKDVVEAIEKYQNMKWYIVQVAAKSEDAAKRNILEQLRVRAAEEQVGMILVPAKKVVELKNGEKKISQKKNYPGYIFILADMNENVMMCTREASKVMAFVEGNGEKLPKPMGPKDINRVIAQLDEDDDVSPTHKVSFEEEQTVTISEGPFQGFNGVIKTVNYEKEELGVSVIIFGRETTVGIGFKSVEKAI
jgi:transcriptional antiterminator NusG